MYQDLLDMEKTLDWTIMQKKAEVLDALGGTASVSISLLILDYLQTCRSLQTTQTLRLFCRIQFQGKHGNPSHRLGGCRSTEFRDGPGNPAWQLKIGGRLLEVSPAELTVSSSPCSQRPVQLPNQRAKVRTPRQFSTLIKSMVVELDRDPALHADSDGYIIEAAA
jgi:SWI/SNF-related matrix-associated actin-dependent regulator of chromatin subfamily D